MPSQDRVGFDEPRGPAFPWDQPGEQHNERSIRRGESRTGDLAAEHGQLVAKDEDLGVLRKVAHPMQSHELHDATS
jgi:hypothetical protein